LKTSFYISDAHQKKIHILKWVPDSGSTRGVVQIIHGLAEHAERYNLFAGFLNKNGFIVYAHDHRGHGKTDPYSLGYIESDDGFHTMVKNIEDVRSAISEDNPGLPLILFGHSMGSFLLQRYMQLYDQTPAGLIYSGSNGKPPASISAGILLSGLLIKLKGKEAKSPLLHGMTFGAYNKRFKHPRTDLDWLSRDPEMVDLYIDDPYCGFVSSTSFFHHFFKGLKTLHAHKPFADHDLSVPILVMSGGSDPVSNMGKGIRNLEKRLKKSGVTNLNVHLYENGRHEMLNEINRSEVMNDILAWIKKQLNHTNLR
jgi:alpha-beta hydrolase superfamily lysophospholipase